MVHGQPTTVLELLNDNGQPRIVTWSETDTGFWGTKDCKWDITNPVNGVKDVPIEDWMSFQSGDGSPLQAKWHCRYVGRDPNLPKNGPWITCLLEQRRMDRSYTWSDRAEMGFKDWQGRKWLARISAIEKFWPAKPVIYVYQDGW
jgi:hypothetical protein